MIIWLKIQALIKSVEFRLSLSLEKRMAEVYSTKLFSFDVKLLNFYLLILELVGDLVKYLIILFNDPGDSFNLFFKQRELNSCPFSYSGYRQTRQKMRAFSLAGVTTLVVATVITSLVTSLFFGGGKSGQAATFGWTQDSWVTASTTAKASHTTNQAGWNYFYSKDANVSIAGGMSLSTASTTWLQTLDGDFNTSAKVGVYVSSNSIKLLKPNGAPCGSGAECIEGVCYILCLSPCNSSLSGGGYCNFNGLAYGATSTADGRVWLDRNLGATRAATASNDSQAYGWSFQWGRGADGHQYLTSLTTATLSGANTPGHANFITSSGDWRNPRNDSLWQGLAGINNPCPPGFRIPTGPEWTTFFTSSSVTNLGTAYSSALKMVGSGLREYSSGVQNYVGNGYYWSSTISGSSASAVDCQGGGCGVVAAMVRGYGTVSYTHLTLPTIYSV